MKATLDVTRTLERSSPEDRLATHLEALAYLLLASIPGLAAWRGNSSWGLFFGVFSWGVLIVLAYIVRSKIGPSRVAQRNKNPEDTVGSTTPSKEKDHE